MRGLFFYLYVSYHSGTGGFLRLVASGLIVNLLEVVFVEALKN